MQEIRCIKCGKLLLKTKEPYFIEIKCTKCKTLQTIGKTEFIDFSDLDLTKETIITLNKI